MRLVALLKRYVFFLIFYSFFCMYCLAGVDLEAGSVADVRSGGEVTPEPAGLSSSVQCKAQFFQRQTGAICSDGPALSVKEKPLPETEKAKSTSISVVSAPNESSLIVVPMSNSGCRDAYMSEKDARLSALLTSKRYGKILTGSRGTLCLAENSQQQAAEFSIEDTDEICPACQFHKAESDFYQLCSCGYRCCVNCWNLVIKACTSENGLPVCHSCCSEIGAQALGQLPGTSILTGTPCYDQVSYSEFSSTLSDNPFVVGQKCIYCHIPYTQYDLKTASLLPCKEHLACKQCLKKHIQSCFENSQKACCMASGCEVEFQSDVIKKIGGLLWFAFLERLKGKKLCLSDDDGAAANVDKKPAISDPLEFYDESHSISRVKTEADPKKLTDDKDDVFSEDKAVCETIDSNVELAADSTSVLDKWGDPNRSLADIELNYERLAEGHDSYSSSNHKTLYRNFCIIKAKIAAGLWKLCPGCNDFIDRVKGHVHMVCKNCRYEFCWVCQNSWRKVTGKTDFSHDHCHMCDDSTPNYRNQLHLSFYRPDKKEGEKESEIRVGWYDENDNRYVIRGAFLIFGLGTVGMLPPGVSAVLDVITAPPH